MYKVVPADGEQLILEGLTRVMPWASLGCDAANNVYVSQWHLSKLINKHMGQSFLDLLAGMRIERAKMLLRGPSMRVHAVAEAVGFSDVAHFSKSFKKPRAGRRANTGPA